MSVEHKRNPGNRITCIHLWTLTQTTHLLPLFHRQYADKKFNKFRFYEKRGRVHEIFFFFFEKKRRNEQKKTLYPITKTTTTTTC